MISSNITGAAAYAAAQRGVDPQDDTQATTSNSFGTVLQGAMDGLTNLGQDADAKSVAAISGTGGMTDVVMAV